MTEWLKVLIWNVSFAIVNEGSNPSFSTKFKDTNNMKLKGLEPLRKIIIGFWNQRVYHFRHNFLSSGYCIKAVPLSSKQEVQVRFLLSAYENGTNWIRTSVGLPTDLQSVPINLSGIVPFSWFPKLYNNSSFKGGYRQEVRQWIVAPLFAGSNPVIHPF